MALTVALAGTVLADTSNNAAYTTASQSVTAGDLIVVFCSPGADTNANWAVTDNQSGTWTRVQRVLRSGSASFMDCWVRDKPVTTSAAFTVTYDRASHAATGGLIAVYKITGALKYGLSAIRQSAVQANQAVNGTPAPAFAIACLTGNAVLGAVNALANPPNVSPTTSGGTFTEDADTGYATPATGLEVQHINSGFTGTTVTWASTSAGGAFCDIVVEIDALGPGGTPQLLRPRARRAITRLRV